MKKAFTLVELLVVISIIMITSFVSINSFFNFVEEQEINSKIMLFEDEIKILDKKVKNKEIFDYSLELKKGDGKYKIIENLADLDKFIKIYNTGKIALQNAKPNDKFNLEIYKGEKLKIFSGGLNNYNLKLDENFDYKIIGYLSGNTEKELNTIYIKNFEKDEKLLKVYKLNDADLQKVFIKNILGKKSIIDNSGNKIDKLKIIFEKNGKQGSLELKEYFP